MIVQEICLRRNFFAYFWNEYSKSMPRTKQFDQKDILRKAMERFWQKGFHATSMQDLVDHLGINRASIYNAFPGGKEQLFQEAFQFYQKEYGFDPALVQQQLENGSVRDFFQHFFQQILDELQSGEEQNGCFITNTTCEMPNQSPEVRSLLQRHMEGMVEFFTQIIQLGQERGEIKNQHAAKTLAKHIYTFINGLKAIARIETDLSSLQQAAEIELSYVFDG